jgi:hypothetical protein
MSANESQPHFKRERDLGDFLVEHPEHLGVLIIGREVRTPFCGRIDLLGIDPVGNLVVIELKLGATKPEVVAQVLEYGYWAKERSRDELIEIASRQPLCLDLPTAFAKYYGHELPETVNRSQTLTVVASTFDATTHHGLEMLIQSGVAIRAYCYFGDRGSVRLAPYRPTEGHRHRDSRGDLQLLRSAELQRLAGPSGADEDIQEFWTIHHPQFVGQFVPFRLIFELYVDWCRREAEQGRHRRAHQMGHFGRRLASIVSESDEWTHESMCPGVLMADEPLSRRLTDWTQPDPDTRMSGYLRRDRGHES